jgi:hypothetical protein
MDLRNEAIITQVRLFNEASQNSYNLESTYGLLVYAGDTLCGQFPNGQTGWETIKCPNVKAK